MNVYEFSERYKISAKKSRQIERENPHWFDGSVNPISADIRARLALGHPCTAAHLCALVENPSLLLDLGNYTLAANQQLAELGNVKTEVAPKAIAANITAAASGDADAVSALVDWLRAILPAKPVNHSYVAVRLLLGLPENVRAFDVPRIPRALLNCRRHPEFTGYWEIKKTLTRTATFYQKPKLGLDL